MDDALARAYERVAEQRAAAPDPSELRAAFDRARSQMEELALATAEIEGSLPEQLEQVVRDGIREGLREEAAPVGRRLAEVHGLLNQLIRRMERLEQDFQAERHARIDDLALMVELISSSWQGLDRKLDALAVRQGEATVYRIERRP